jgi:hypothetical protein
LDLNLPFRPSSRFQDAPPPPHRLAFARPCGAETIYADLVTGDLELEVPDRAYQVQSEVTTGSIEIDVVTSPNAEAYIGASVVTGAVHVHANR